MFTLGIDISKWEDSNYTVAKPDMIRVCETGSQFIYIKTGQGIALDEDWRINWHNSYMTPLVRGAYWYLDFRFSIPEQADRFILALSSTDGRGGLPPVVDYEQSGIAAKGTMLLGLKTFLEKVKAAFPTMRPMIYTGPNFWTMYGSTDSYWTQYPLWIAHYGVKNPKVPAPFKSWAFWQFTDKLPGYAFGMESAGVDGDFFNGNRDDLDSFIAGGGVPLA